MGREEFELAIEAQSIQIIGKAIQAVQKACPNIEKGGENKAQSYKFVTEEALVRLIRNSCIENGLILTPSRVHSVNVETGLGRNSNTHLATWVQDFQLAHIDGHAWPWPIEILCSGADQGDKATWKGLTAGHRYAWLRILMMPTGDDPEADSNTDREFDKRYKGKDGPKEPEIDEAGLIEWIAEDPDGTFTKEEGAQWKLWPFCDLASYRQFGVERTDEEKLRPITVFQSQHKLDGIPLSSAGNPMLRKHVPLCLKFLRKWASDNR